MSRKIDLSSVLAPLGEFGKWIGLLLPTFKVSIQDYIKIPLSGLPHFIIAIEAKVNFNCGILNKVGDALKAANEKIKVIDNDLRIYKFLGPKVVRDLCGQKQTLRIKMSLEFTGFSPNTYVEIGTGSLHKSLLMTEFPVCPPPVKHVCAFDLTLVFFCLNNNVLYLLSVFRVVVVW